MIYIKSKTQNIIKLIVVFFVFVIISFNSIAKSQTVEVEVSRGDNLYLIFAENDISVEMLNKIMQNSMARTLNFIYPGDKIIISKDDNKLKKIIFNPLNRNPLIIHYENNDFIFNSVNIDPEKEALQKSEIIITKSLNYDGKKAGISRDILDLIIKNFSWDLNFSKDVKKGDKFIIFWDRNKTPKAMVFVGDKTIALFAHRTKKHGIQFYNIKGETTNDTFTLAPLEYSRISSAFSQSRYHPVLKIYRPHRGVDFAAPTGTPIYAPAKGIVKRIATLKGYGNVIFLSHGDNIITVYAHLSKFANNLKIGKKIEKGMLIGYVGSTGMSTGPHLHYEIRINEVHKDPINFKMSKKLYITKSELPDFQKNAKYILSKLQI